MGTEKKRKAVIRKILQSIIKAHTQGLGLKRTKLEAMICIDEGVTPKKAKEYIDTLIKAERIIQDDEGLYLHSSVELEDDGDGKDPQI